MICQNCGYVILSFKDYWVYEDKNKDENIFCCKDCYNEGVKELIKKGLEGLK